MEKIIVNQGKVLVSSDGSIVQQVSQSLMGTKWKMNDELTPHPISAGTKWYNVYAKYWYDDTHFVVHNDSSEGIELYRHSDGYTVFWSAASSSGGLSNDNMCNYRSNRTTNKWACYDGSMTLVSNNTPTMEIISGNDVDNPEFVAWLQANATKVG